MLGHLPPLSLCCSRIWPHREIAAKRIAQQDSLEEARISMWSRVRKEWTLKEEQKMPSFIKEPGEIWLDSHSNFYSMLEMQGQQCTRKFTKRSHRRGSVTEAVTRCMTFDPCDPTSCR